MSEPEDPDPPIAEGPLSPYFGDYPDGAYWSAIPIPGARKLPERDEFAVQGDLLRLMWDYGAGPLWDADGPLPAERRWLKRALGLGDDLIADLLAWFVAMEDADQHHPDQRHPDQAHPDSRLLEAQARTILTRLQTELGNRFQVRFHP